MATQNLPSSSSESSTGENFRTFNGNLITERIEPLHEQAGRLIRDTFDIRPTAQDIAEFLQNFYGPLLPLAKSSVPPVDSYTGTLFDDLIQTVEDVELAL